MLIDNMPKEKFWVNNKNDDDLKNTFSSQNSGSQEKVKEDEFRK